MNSIFEEARYKAIKYIGISKKTTFEVRRKLLSLKYDNDMIENVIEYLLSLNYLNDLEYVKSFILQNKRLKKYSVFEIINKLKIKGIIINDYMELFDELYNSNYENLVIKKLLESKLKDYDDVHKKNYLFRKGFKDFSYD